MATFLPIFLISLPFHFPTLFPNSSKALYFHSCCWAPCSNWWEEKQSQQLLLLPWEHLSAFQCRGEIQINPIFGLADNCTLSGCILMSSVFNIPDEFLSTSTRGCVCWQRFFGYARAPQDPWIYTYFYISLYFLFVQSAGLVSWLRDSLMHKNSF